MNAINLNKASKIIKSKLIMKGTKETEQYSNKKIRILLKPSTKNMLTKSVAKNDASKNSKSDVR